MNKNIRIEEEVAINESVGNTEKNVQFTKNISIVATYHESIPFIRANSLVTERIPSFTGDEKFGIFRELFDNSAKLFVSQSYAILSLLCERTILGSIGLTFNVACSVHTKYQRI